MKKIYYAVITLCCLGLLLITEVSAETGSPESLTFEDLTPGNFTGFGDSWNRYAWSMEVYDGDVYVGTWNQDLKIAKLIRGINYALPRISTEGLNFFYKNVLGTLPVSDSRGGEIWKYATDNGTWIQIVDNGYNDTYNTGYRIAKQYNGAVYFGSANYENGAQMLAVTDNGASVSVVEPDDIDLRKEWYANESNRSMEVHKGKLYIGKENTQGAELWSYDGASLKKEHVFTELSVGQLCVFGDYLFAGMWDFEAGMKLYRIRTDDEGSVVTIDDMTPPELQGTYDKAILSLTVFRDKLFAGTGNDSEGFTLFCITSPDAEPASPEGYRILGTRGFGDSANMYAWSMIEFENVLYLGTFNIFGPQLWFSRDGESWDKLITDGFGSLFEWGVRCMAKSDNRLFIGTACSVPSSAYPGTPGGLKVFAGSRAVQ